MRRKDKWFRILKKVVTGKRESSKEEISMEELKEMQRQNPGSILLDVRSPQEYQEGHLNNSILIPSYEIKEKAERILTDKKALILVYCQSGGRSKKATKQLKQLGYEQVYWLKGGLEQS